MPLPNKKFLPSLDGLEKHNLIEEDSDETEIIELSDADFGNYNEDFVEEITNTDFDEEIEPLKQHSFSYDDDFIENNRKDSADFLEKNNIQNAEKENKYELFSKKKTELSINKKQIKNIIIGLIIVGIGVALIFFGIKLYKNKLGNKNSTNNIQNIEENITLSIIENNLVEAKIIPKFSGSGKVQALYKKEDVVVLCESIETDFTVGEQRITNLSCYNLEEDEELADYDEFYKKIIEK